MLYNYPCYSGLRWKARVLKCKPFFVAKSGVMVPGVPCLNRGNWGRECDNLGCYVLARRKQHKLNSL